MASTAGMVRFGGWRALVPLTLLASAGCLSSFGDDVEAEESDKPVNGPLTDDPSGGIDPGGLAEDLVSPAATDGASSPLGDYAQAPGDSASSRPPKVVYLVYADGKPLSRGSPNPCRDTPPKFVCEFAPTLGECQRQIQAYVDKWYADFNVVFTLTRPTAGTYYTEVISSGGGAWCDAAANVAGVAPFLCDDLDGGVAYTFLGGKTAKETAIIIAQEQAHLVGLEHTLSARDVMSPTICTNCDGFEDTDNKIQNDHCNRSRQNSYDMMKARLGIWNGGIKPTAFGCQPDNAPPAVQILSPADNAAVKDTFVLRAQASDACQVSRVTVSVQPMGLQAESKTPPFEWTLNKLTGRQTITVTAFDGSGKQASSSVTVRAGTATTGGGGSAAGGATGRGGAGAAPGGAGGDTTAATSGEMDGAGCGCALARRGAATPSGAGWLLVGSSLAAMLVISAMRSRRRVAALSRPGLGRSRLGSA